MIWNDFVESAISAMRANAALSALVDDNFYAEKVRPEINSSYIVFYKGEETIERYLNCTPQKISYLVYTLVTFEVVTNDRISNETGLSILNTLIPIFNEKGLFISNWKAKGCRLISTMNFPEKNLWINGVNFRFTYCSY